MHSPFPNQQRRRRVRLSYPKPLVELVLNLIPYFGVIRLAAAADIPPSVIYRWRKAANNSLGIKDSSDTKRIFDLLVRYSGSSALIGALSKLAEEPSGVSMETLDNRPRLSNVHISIKGGVMQRLEAARQLIHERYSESITCAKLADAAQMSRTYFIRMFGEAFGSTPHQYLVRVRIAAAKKLLDRSGEPIDVVAAGVGFRTGASLGRAFKRVEGRSVSEIHTYTIATGR